jgi:hypothetical protein
MRHLIILCIGLAFFECAFAQHLIKGTVLDTHHKPLPYCSIQLKGTHTGCISNEDGVFVLKYTAIGDSLLFSYLAFKPLALTVAQLIKNPQAILEPDVYELGLTEIKPNDEELYILLSQCRRLALAGAETTSKAWFSLESANGGNPIEVIESYHNAQLANNQLNNLSLKCGRIGHDTSQYFAFVSLNPSRLLTSYKVFYQTSYRLPINPLQLGLNQLKKQYSIVLISRSGENGSIYHIRLLPKRKGKAKFSADVWVDKQSLQLKHLSIKASNLTRHPFVPIQPTHRIDSVNMRLVYHFKDEGGKPFLEYIDLNYSMRYTDAFTSQTITSNGVVYLYAYSAAFEPPIMELPPDISDYEAILSYPYNKLFWQRNETVELSSKKKSYLNYFLTHGMLFNFESLGKAKLFSSPSKALWSATNRLTLDDLKTYKPNYATNTKKQGFVFDNKYAATLFNLSGQLFMDPNSYPDTLDLLTATVIDLDKSFYNAPKHELSQAFVNIYFDLIEVQRRKLVDQLRSQSLAPSAIHELYRTSNLQIQQTLKRYLNEVERGRNLSSMKKWNQVVFDALHINNLPPD